MGFFMQNMGNDPTSQLYIEIFGDMHGYLGQNRGGGLNLSLYLLPVAHMGELPPTLRLLNFVTGDSARY